MMQMQQHEKAAKTEMEKLKLTASFQLVTLLETIPEVNAPGTGNIFIPFSPKVPNETPITEQLSAYNVIHRFQSHISTTELTESDADHPHRKKS